MTQVLHEQPSPGSSQEYYRNHLLMFSEAFSEAFSDMTTLCIGEVFNQLERIAYCESADLSSARQYCRQIVDDSLARRSAERSGLHPDQAQLNKAIASIAPQIDSALEHLLTTHRTHQNTPLNIETLKRNGGFHSTTDVFLAYAEFARKLCDAMSHNPPTQSTGQDPYLSMVIDVHYPDHLSSESVSLSLKPALFSALGQLISD